MEGRNKGTTPAGKHLKSVTAELTSVAQVAGDQAIDINEIRRTAE
uniref:Uncharacterized protein n=1 Tax=Arundo donax TaxID=35708 RepID=A0A0A8XPM4_ARUDO